VRGRGRARSLRALLPSTLLLVAAPVLAVELPHGAPAQAPPPARPSQAPPTLPSADALELRLSLLDRRKAALDDELREGTAEQSTLEQRSILRGRAYYKLVRAGLLPVGGGFDALVDHAARVERLRQSLLRDVERKQVLDRRLREVRDELARIDAERAPLVVQREAVAKARTLLAEADERKRAFERAFQTSERPDYVAIYGAGIGPSDVDAKAGFPSQRGRLPFPVAGRAEVRRESVGAGPAMVLAVPEGTPSRAVAAGRVAFADKLDGYGLVVLLDHGDHYYTLYGGHGALDVRRGDTVRAGHKLGTVGAAPGSARGPGLVFEVRRGAEILDPSPWVGM
jgi:murein DD-endopeptidase MepM/ murein hydrolase activator NlpD